MTATGGPETSPDGGPANAPGVCGIPKCLMGLPWRYALGCIDDLGLILRAEIIWDKPNGLPEIGRPTGCGAPTSRCSTSRRQPRYFAAVDEIREPSTSLSPAHDSRRRQRPTDSRMDLVGGGRTSTMNPAGKLPGSVWDITPTPLNVPEWLEHGRCCGGRKQEGCEDGLDHHAAFPFDLVRKVVLGGRHPESAWSAAKGASR